MPVEVKELIIRAVVDYPDSDKTINPESDQLDQSELVKACVKQVLKSLRKQKNR